MQSMDGKKIINVKICHDVRICHGKSLLILILFSYLFLPLQVFAADEFVKFVGKKGAKVFLEVAVTQEQKNKGLMNRSSLPQNKGMVFVFRPKTTVTFWMKDTLISLDMIFIDRGKIVKIVKNAAPNQTTTLYPSDFSVTEVIEVNGGYTDMFSIKSGDRIVFKNIPQIDYSVKSKAKVKT